MQALKQLTKDQWDAQLNKYDNDESSVIKLYFTGSPVLHSSILAQCVNLTSLSLVSLMPKLKGINVMEPRVEQGVCLPSLRYLDLSDNKVANLESGVVYPSLIKLTISNNKLGEYPCYKNTSIECNYDQYVQLLFSPLASIVPKLEKLDIEYNPVVKHSSNYILEKLLIHLLPNLKTVNKLNYSNDKFTEIETASESELDTSESELGELENEVETSGNEVETSGNEVETSENEVETSGNESVPNVEELRAESSEFNAPFKKFKSE